MVLLIRLANQVFSHIWRVVANEETTCPDRVLETIVKLI